MATVNHANYTIELKEVGNLSSAIGEIYLGTNIPSANCNYQFPSQTNQCSLNKTTNSSS